MQNITTYLLRITLVMSLLAALPFYAQAQCYWRLHLQDSGGDGWGGAALYLDIDNDFFFYDLDGVTDNGTDTTILIEVTEGQLLSLQYFGPFQGNNAEITFELFDGSNNLVFGGTDMPSPSFFDIEVTCPDCALPQDVVEESIYNNRVKIKWAPGVSDFTGIGWWVIHGPAGFVPGPGVGDTLYVTTPKATITGLMPKTGYTYYIRQDCGNGSTSGLLGPFNFTTYWSNDVGATTLLAPLSGCDLQAETITFAMKNFGSNPQSLIPYTFFVNGQPGGVPQPDDGYFTGVIGKDSVEVIEFETSFDFSDKIEYEIMVVTQMEGDEDTSNDTLRFYINNALAPDYAQGFERWNAGWTPVPDTLNFSLSSTWEYGKPDAPIISAAGEGQKAWVTNLQGPTDFYETSYLVSSCFDFTGVTKKPAVSFLINHSLQTLEEGAFMDYSLDNGATWVRIGSGLLGGNWYNSSDPITGNALRAWSGESNGWKRTHRLVNGIAGEPNVLFRFGMVATFYQSEGVGIDDFRVFIPFDKDASSVGIKTLGETSVCGLANDKVTLNVLNAGLDGIPSGYVLYYAVNGVLKDSFVVSNNLLTPEENFSHTFTVGFNSVDQLSVIQAWIKAADDQNPLNDTITYTVDHRPAQLPLYEDFEASANFPQDWEISNNAFMTTAHGNISRVLSINLYAGTPSFSYTLPRHGVVGVGDSVKFDYRIVDYFTPNPPTSLGAGNKIEVQVSDNCGQSFTTIGTINSVNHVPSSALATRKFALSNFVGESILVRFLGTWASGDYYVDLDNINILACGADMGLSATIQPASPGQSNGTATVNVSNGNPPYQYLWSNGATTAAATGLGAGTYTVAVLDAHGCQDTLAVEVLVNNVVDLPGITTFAARPNPTTGLLFLNLQFEQDVVFQAEVVNLLGQSVWATPAIDGDTFNEAIDLSSMPNGIYLLRVTANGTVYSKKIVVNK